MKIIFILASTNYRVWIVFTQTNFNFSVNGLIGGIMYIVRKGTILEKLNYHRVESK